MKNKLLIAFISTISFGVVSCSTVSDPATSYPGQSPSKIFNDGKASLMSRNYGDAAKHFEALDVQYPFYSETITAQLYLVYAYYMKEDYAMAVAAADHFIRMNPTNPHVDYALYMRGLSEYYENMGIVERLMKTDLAKRDLTQIQKSYQDFHELVLTHPNSPYANDAKHYMIYLRNILANHELEVAQYYYTRKAYVASANRARAVVAHYQGAPAVNDALRLMADSYHALGLTKLEDDTKKVMQFNHLN